MTKFQLFINNASLLSENFGITPLLYGSLGLEYLTGSDLGADDIDILIPKAFVTDRWDEFRTVLENDGYILIDEHEHTFEKRGVCYSYAQIEELAAFAGIEVRDIRIHTHCDTDFLLLSLEQYLKVYQNSIKDGYRIDVRGKKDADKIDFICKQLKNMDTIIYLPQNIKKLTEGKSYVCDDLGLSGSTVLLYDDMVLKIEPDSKHVQNTIAMMHWMNGKMPVPRVIAHEVENGKSYLLMSRVKGKMACDDYYLQNSDLMVRLLADTLRKLWQVDISDCPITIRLDDELQEAQYNIDNGHVDIEGAQPDTYGENGFESPQHLLDWLKANKPVYDPVLSHGDFCLPNIFYENDILSGLIDIGRSGICDRYKDIALCWRSLQNNFNGSYGGPVYPDFDADLLFEMLEIKPDREKIRYYILLDELF